MIISDPNSRINSLDYHSTSVDMNTDPVTQTNNDQIYKEPSSNNTLIPKQENGEGPLVVEVTSKVLTTKEDPIQVEHVNIPSSKGTKGCCSIM